MHTCDREFQVSQRDPRVGAQFKVSPLSDPIFGSNPIYRSRATSLDAFLSTQMICKRSRLRCKQPSPVFFSLAKTQIRGEKPSRRRDASPRRRDATSVPTTTPKEFLEVPLALRLPPRPTSLDSRRPVCMRLSGHEHASASLACTWLASLGIKHSIPQALTDPDRRGAGRWVPSDGTSSLSTHLIGRPLPRYSRH